MAPSTLALGLLALVGTSVGQISFGTGKGIVAGRCSGQSCDAADVAGITGNLPRGKPKGGSAAGWTCVQKYNPALAGAGGRTVSDMAYMSDDDTPSQPLALARRQLGKLGGGRYTGACTQNILLWARGTMEVGNMGSTVGPKLSRQLPKGQWTVVGVPYNADVAGDNCVGLPGGMIAKNILESAAAKCPRSNLFTAGYSQGAMVARIAVAYASPDVKSRVKGILTFGDPFNGAKIRGYSGPIKIFCRPTDAVCGGEFKIGAGHMAYISGTDSAQGATWLKSMARG